MKYIYAPIPDKFDALSTQARTVWVSLCYYADWNATHTRGQCWPAQDRLRSVFDLSRRSIITGLRELEDAGLIHRKVKMNGKTRVGTSYMMLTDADTGIQTPASTQMMTEEQIDGHFETLFSHWPNKAYKADAKAAFKALFPLPMSRDQFRTLYYELQDRANRDAEAWEDVGTINPRFVPQLGNWIRKSYGY